MLCALTFGALMGSAVGQTGGDVLVPGNPPLKQSDVGDLIKFYEWVFEAKFTNEQREEFTANTAEEYRKDAKGTRGSIDQISSSLPQIFGKTAAEQGRLRDALSGDLVAQARTGSDANSRLLTAVYEAAHRVVREGASDEGAGASVGNVAALAGKWVSGSSGSSTYTTGGSLLGSNGSRFTYQFLPNGSVEYTGIMNVMSGGCTMQVFKSSKGSASLAGDTLTINWSPANFSRADSCSPSQDYKKVLPAETQTFKVKFKEAYGQKELCLTEKGETCFRPVK